MQKYSTVRKNLKLTAIFATIAIFFFTACSNEPTEPKPFGKVWFFSDTFDYLDDAIVNVYVDGVLIGTLTESFDEESQSHLLKEAETSFPFGILYKTNKDHVVRYEVLPEGDIHIKPNKKTYKGFVRPDEVIRTYHMYYYWVQNYLD